MRANPDAQEFAEVIEFIGNGEYNDEKDFIDRIPDECFSENALHTEIFESAIKNKNYENLKDFVILAPLNKNVESNNEIILSMLKEKAQYYQSIDTVNDWDGPPLLDEILENYKDPGFSLPSLTLKEHAIIMLLRNLNQKKKLCNGTRMQILQLGERFLKCKIITGSKANRIVFLPKITLIDDMHFDCELHRYQFPVKLAFAMSINKAQGQSFKKVGIDLTEPVFSHGQLYVALSRAPSWNDIKIKLPLKRENNNVKNIVRDEVFSNLS